MVRMEATGIQGFPRRVKDGGSDDCGLGVAGAGAERTRGNKLSARWRLAFRWPHPLVGIAWCAIAASSSALFFGNLRFGTQALGLVYSDDFFYYAQVARNLALHSTSTFDGIHRTNGYHPLWLLVLTLATKLFGSGGVFHASTVVPFAAALATLQFSIVIAIAYFAFRVSNELCGVAVSCCIQLLVVAFVLIMVCSGMEAGLALVLLFGLLRFRLRADFRWSSRQSFTYGLIAGLMVLARIDAMLLVALLLIFDVFPNGFDEGGRARRGLWFCMGLWPVAVYVLLNEWFFHTLLPVSGMAKQLRHHLAPSLSALRSLPILFGIRSSYLLGPCVLVALLALALLGMGMRAMLPGRRGVIWAVLLFPFVYILTIVSLSDWGVWPWYLYAWPATGAVAGAIVFSGRRARAQASVSWSGLACFAASVCYLIFMTVVIVRYSSPRNNDMYLTALDVRQFAENHPGIYAMGDRAGAVGYLADVPVIQLEGLMMDKQYLDNIRAQRDVQDVLKQYEVRYYIFTSMRAGPDADGCYSAREPAQAGPDSPVMRAHICKTPVAVFQHGGYVNDVFDMQ